MDEQLCKREGCGGDVGPKDKAFPYCTYFCLELDKDSRLPAPPHMPYETHAEVARLLPRPPRVPFIVTDDVPDDTPAPPLSPPRPSPAADTADRAVAALKGAPHSARPTWPILVKRKGLPPGAQREPVLPLDSEVRKGIPIFSGVLNYFPLAIAAVARVSKRGNDKHNPGQALHWARGKSMDHDDCIARHLIDIETLDAATGEYEDAMALAWRALARLQELEEKRLGKAPSRGSRFAVPAVAVPAVPVTP